MKKSIKLSRGLWMLIFSIVFFFSCKKEGGTNKTPVAIAGRDTIIVLPVDSVILDGSASYDPDGSITEFSWSKISGPSSLLLINPQSAITKVKNMGQGTYRFQLKVIDNNGLTAMDTVMITVDAVATTNHPPIAVAGPDQSIYLPVNTKMLDGSSSSDPDNNIISYQWTKISGPSSFNITNQNAVQTQVTSLIAGTYQFQLKVTDAAGLFSKDTVQVIVVSQNSACDIDSRAVIQAHLVPLGKLSIGRQNMVTAAVNNKVLFVGGSVFGADNTGSSTRRVDIYDINSNSWSTKDLGPFPTWRFDMGISSADNKIFIAGGGFWGDDLYTNEVDVYNATDNSWSSTSLSEARTASTGVSAGNNVFFAGGYSYPYWSNKVDIFNNVTNTWTTATLSEYRGYLSAVTAYNKVYFAGGEKNDGQFVPSNRIDEYDMLTNSWSTSTLQEARSNMAAIAVGNKVFWAGGQHSNFGVSGTVEIRDVVSGATSFACIIPKALFGAVLKYDNIIFFTGGGSDPRDGSHFDIYNLSTDTWYTGLLDKSITGAAIISVNNVIYVAGGIVNGVGSDQVWKLEF